jgi:class 3 adenylate cyclase
MVAFMLTDIEGSTRLWQEHPQGMRDVIGRHDSLLTECIERRSGRVLKTRGEGDSIFAIFTRASDAVAAASDIQRALLEEPWPEGIAIGVRIAIHAGEAERDYRGLAVNRCARLRALASGGQVLVSQSTQALVRDELPAGLTLVDLGEYPLRDLAIPERVFQLNTVGLPTRFRPIGEVKHSVSPPWWLLVIMALGSPLPLLAASFAWTAPQASSTSIGLNILVTVLALLFLIIPALALAGLLSARRWARPLAIGGLLALGSLVLLVAAASLASLWSSRHGFRAADPFESVYAIAALPLLVVHLVAAAALYRNWRISRLLVTVVCAFWIIRYGYGLSLSALVLWLIWHEEGFVTQAQK